jgi:beta-N-acetylhexosaminidase
MKNWTTKLLILVLFILLIISAYNYFKKPFLKKFSQNSGESTGLVATPTPSQTPKKELNTKEKITQLLAVSLDLNEMEKNSTESARALRFIEDSNPGFVLYFGEKVSTTSAILATKTIFSYLKDENSYLPLIAVDHEGGLVQRLSGEGFTKLDSWQKIVNTYSSAQQKAVFNQSARELKAVGVNIVFAPVVDLASNSAVLKTRVAADPEKTFAATNNFIYAFSQNAVMAVLKHFPGIGSIDKDLHNEVSTISLSTDDTQIFSKVLDKFTNIGVMTTHVKLENKLAGKVCSLSEECLSQFAKSYPKVLLFTDDLMMKSARAQVGTTEEKDISVIAVEAIEAGNNVLVFGPGVDSQTLEKTIYALEREYKDSESFRKKVDDSLQKILSLKK